LLDLFTINSLIVYKFSKFNTYPGKIAKYNKRAMCLLCMGNKAGKNGIKVT